MKKKNAGSLKEIVRNNSFAVSLIWKHCPFKIVYSFLRSFADGILGTAELFFIGHAISLAASGSSYLDVCKYLMIYIAINIAYNVITAVLTAKSEPIFNYKIGCGIKRMFLQKALDCDLRCYEDTQFYKDFTIAAAQCIPRAEAALSMISGLITSITALCSLGVLSYLIDPVVFLFFLAPVLRCLSTERNQKQNLGCTANKPNITGRRIIACARFSDRNMPRKCAYQIFRHPYWQDLRMRWTTVLRFIKPKE